MNESNAQAIIDAAMQAAEAELIDTVDGHQKALVTSKGQDVTLIDLDRYSATPDRHRGTAKLRDPKSFLAYVAQITSDTDWEHQVGYYGDPDTLKVVAVFNDHGGLPGWRDFRAELTFERTPEWLAWTKADKQFGSASAFAEHVEDWRHTILEPDAAAIVDMVRSFKATRTVSFRDEIVDRSGDRAIEWVQETQAGTTKGSLEIPDSFTLQLAPFIGAEQTELVARFRYRLDDGQATFGVSLEQPDKLIRDAFENEVLELIGAVGGHVMLGTPADDRP